MTHFQCGSMNPRYPILSLIHSLIHDSRFNSPPSIDTPPIDHHPIPAENALTSKNSECIPGDQRNQNPSLHLPRRRGPPTLRINPPFPRTRRSQRSRSRSDGNCTAQRRRPCNPVHSNAADHREHGNRVLRSYAARAREAFRMESGG